MIIQRAKITSWINISMDCFTFDQHLYGIVILKPENEYWKFGDWLNSYRAPRTRNFNTDKDRVPKPKVLKQKNKICLFKHEWICDIGEYDNLGTFPPIALVTFQKNQRRSLHVPRPIAIRSKFKKWHWYRWFNALILIN